MKKYFFYILFFGWRRLQSKPLEWSRDENEKKISVTPKFSFKKITSQANRWSSSIEYKSVKKGSSLKQKIPFKENKIKLQKVNRGFYNWFCK